IPSARAPSLSAVPPKDPFRTRRQLPRTPLSSKNGNGVGSRLPGSRARSASPSVTKIPRSSHFARSASPARTPSGPKTPRRCRSSALAIGQGFGAAGTAGKSLPTVSTPVADTKRIEEEMLAAFARTPKLARTPPKDSAPSLPPADAVASAAAPAGELRGGAHPMAQLSTAPPSTAASTQEQQPSQQQAEHSRSPEAAVETAALQPQPNGSLDAAAAEPARELAFWKSMKVGGRTPGTDGSNNGKAVDDGGNSAGVAGFERLADGEEKGSKPQEWHQQSFHLPPTAVHASVSPAPAPAAGARGEPARRGLVAGDSPSGSSSPSASLDSSCATTTNVRSLSRSACKNVDGVGVGARRAAVGGRGAELRGVLTPAAFKGLTSAMRTPSTGVKSRDTLVNEVPQMRSLDVVSTNAALQHAPRASAAPRAKKRAASARPRYASSVAEAKSAAEAAAAATAAKKSAAAAVAAAASASAAADAGGPTTSTSTDGPAVSSGNTAVAVPLPPAQTSATTPGILPGTAVSGKAPERGVGAAAPPLGSSESGPAPGVSLYPAPIREAVAALPSAPPINDELQASAVGAGEPEATSGDAGGPEAGDADPFVRSHKLARTPPAPPSVASAAVARQTRTADAAARADVLPTAGADRTCDAGLHAGAQAEAAVPAAMALAPEDSEPLDEAQGGRESPEAVCGNPFASRSNIPRTPTDQVAPLPESSSRDSAGGGEGGDAEPADAGEAQLRIEELRQEVASMADRLAKQADERKRLADVAFEAQDEAIKLRQQLQEIQQARSQGLLGDEAGGAAPESDGDGGTAAEDGAPSAIRGMEGDATVSTCAAVVGATEERVMQLEIEKWQTEQSKKEAEKEAERAGQEARQAKAALERAQAKVRELALSAETRHEEMLEERLRRDRERCKQHEREIEEHQMKV
ncbi:unnamed protein product, partial [Hapterophycus canaliculatus]